MRAVEKQPEEVRAVAQRGSGGALQRTDRRCRSRGLQVKMIPYDEGLDHMVWVCTPPLTETCWPLTHVANYTLMEAYPPTLYIQAHSVGDTEGLSSVYKLASCSPPLYPGSSKLCWFVIFTSLTILTRELAGIVRKVPFSRSKYETFVF